MTLAGGLLGRTRIILRCCLAALEDRIFVMPFTISSGGHYAAWLSVGATGTPSKVQGAFNQGQRYAAPLSGLG